MENPHGTLTPPPPLSRRQSCLYTVTFGSRTAHVSTSARGRLSSDLGRVEEQGDLQDLLLGGGGGGECVQWEEAVRAGVQWGAKAKTAGARNWCSG